MKHAGSLSTFRSCTVWFFCLLGVEVCTTWRLHDRICSDWVSCKCERSEGIHFQLRAPLCTAMKYLVPCHILSTGVTSGQTPIPLSTHGFPFTRSRVRRGGKVCILMRCGFGQASLKKHMLALSQQPRASGACQIQEAVQLIACDMVREECLSPSHGTHQAFTSAS